MKFWKVMAKLVAWCTLNGLLGCVAVIIYVVGIDGLFTRPSFNGALFGVAVLSLFFLALFAQLYWFVIKKQSKKVKKIAFGSGSVFLFIFWVFSGYLVYHVYLGDEDAYQEPIFSYYAKQMKHDEFTFDKKRSNRETYRNDDYHFYFIDSTRQLTNYAQVESLLAYLPENVDKKFTFTFILDPNGYELLTLSFDENKHLISCHDDENEMYKNCEFLHETTSSNNVLRMANAITELNNNYGYFKVFLEASKETKNPSTFHLYVRKEGGVLQESDIVRLYYAIGRLEKQTTFTLHVAEMSEDPRNTPSIILTFDSFQYDGIANPITYDTCSVYFCKQIDQFYPRASDDDPKRYLYKK